MSGEVAARAFAADPSPATARALLAALTRERRPGLSPLLGLIDDRAFPQLCAACEALPASPERTLLWEAVSALIADLPDAERRLAPRHLAAFTPGGSGETPAPLLRAIDPDSCDDILGVDLPRLLASHPQLTTLRMTGPAGRAALGALPEGAVDLSLSLEDLDGLLARPWPELRRITIDHDRLDEVRIDGEVLRRMGEAPLSARLEAFCWRESLLTAASSPFEGADWPALAELVLPAQLFPRELGRLPSLRRIELVASPLRPLAPSLTGLMGEGFDELRLRTVAPADLEAAAGLGLQPTELASQLPEIGALFGAFSRLAAARFSGPRPARGMQAALRGLEGVASLRELEFSDPFPLQHPSSLWADGLLEALVALGPWPVERLILDRSPTLEQARALSEAFPRLQSLVAEATGRLPELCERFAGLTELRLRLDGVSASDARAVPPPGLRLAVAGDAEDVTRLLRSPLREALTELQVKDSPRGATEAALPGWRELPLPRLERLSIPLSAAPAAATPLSTTPAWPALRALRWHDGR